MLPYLLKEEGLMKYLILAYPILPSPVSLPSRILIHPSFTQIEMTSKCLLERFTSEKSFLKDFWSSCEFLSSLPENILSKKSSPLDRLAASIRQLVKKQSEMNGRPNLSENRGEFCTEVNDSSLIIKSLALNLLDNLLETMFNVFLLLMLLLLKSIGYRSLRKYLTITKLPWENCYCNL